MIFKCRCMECRDAYLALGDNPRERRRNGPTPPHVHGTWNGYSNYACRCDACTEACRRQYAKGAAWARVNREFLSEKQRIRRAKAKGRQD